MHFQNAITPEECTTRQAYKTPDDIRIYCHSSSGTNAGDNAGDNAGTLYKLPGMPLNALNGL